MVLRFLQRGLLMFGAALCLGLLPAGPAMAKKKAATPPPEITSFEMDPVNQLTPGSELFFRVQGTANGRATVRVAGVMRTLVLEEVDDGVYEGSYLLHANDHPTPNSPATATLRRSGRSTTATMNHLAAAQSTQKPAQQPVPKPAVLAISRFTATPIDKFEPGAELKFQLEGTPGARASFSIANVIANVPMREASPGHYEGSYTIRRLDKVPSGVEVTASLEAGGQTAHSTLGRASVLADTKPPVVRNEYPRNGDVITAGLVPVSGTFDDQGGVGVDPKTVKFVVAGRDVTAQSTITRDSFTYRAELVPGSYAAEVSAKDFAGNAVHSAWSFTVQPQAAPLSLDVTSPHQNAVVPAGRLEIRGHAAPGATVSVNATGYASVAGMVGITQPLYKGSTTADGNGDFVISFVSPFTAPGLRYEIDLKAEQGGRTRETRLVVFQAH